MLTKKQKGFSTILVVAIALVVIAGGVVVWQYWQEQVEQEVTAEQEPLVVDETADWQTYRNEEYGFEIKYPEDWSIQEDKDKYKVVFQLPGIPFERVEKGGIKTGVVVNTTFDITFSIDTTKKYQSAEAFMEQSGMNDSINWLYGEPILTSVGGTDFYYYAWLHQLQGEHYFTIRDGYEFEIQFVMNNFGAENPAFYEMTATPQYDQFQKTLKTFRFID